MSRLGLYILLFFTAAITTGAVEDQVYPPAGDFISRYVIPGSDFRAGDTITIIRDFVNNDLLPVNNIYLSEHIPPADSIGLVSHSAWINGNPITYQYYKEGSNAVIDGNDSYYWVIDSPSDGIFNTMNPGDSLRLEISIVIPHEDYYLLPMHTTVFENAQSAFFATTEAMALVIGSKCGDVNSDDTVNLLDITYLIEYLYLDGPDPVPYDSGDINGDGSLNILDITYLILFVYRSGLAPVCP